MHEVNYYPTFAWFWDHDRKRLSELGYDKIIEKIREVGIEPEDIGDLEMYGNGVVVVWTRDERKIIVRIGDKA